MESLTLKIFREVATTKSITKAAENLGYVQSNVTAHIKKLEDELSTTLFIRSHTGVSLTKDGEKLLKQVEKIVQLFDETYTLFQPKNTTLTIGTNQTMAGYLLPKCMLELQTKHSTLKLSLTTLHPDVFESKLYHNELDCIITNQPYAMKHAIEVYHQDETLLLITPSTCTTINDITSYPLIINNIPTCPYRKILLDWWKQTFDNALTIMEVDTVEAIIESVKLGGVSLLPKYIDTKDEITSFYVEELQGSSIHMWVSKEKEFIYMDEILQILMKTIE